MKALILTFDKYRPITEHMLRTYECLWPQNPFTFVIPYQVDSRLDTHHQRVELVRTDRDIMTTVDALLECVDANEWVYWCIDDKFVLDVDSESASYFADYLVNEAPASLMGFCFCRARRLLVTPHVSESPIATTPRGDKLLRRYDYNQIWLHQFLRGHVLRELFDTFGRSDFPSTEMDAFTRQGEDALKVPPVDVMCVTQDNFLVLGESTVNQRVTRTYLRSMTKWGLRYPVGFDSDDSDIVIGSRGCWHGE